MFIDRIDAGQKLAEALIDLRDRSDSIVVLAIPRGGVMIGREVARSIHAPLDVILTHKLGAPDNPELAIGAVAEDGLTILLDQELLQQLQVSQSYLDAEIDRQKREMQRRAAIYRRGRERLAVTSKIVIVVDDGAATGSTLIAALRSVRSAGAQELIAAVPVGPNQVVRRLRHEADRVVCLLMPIDFWAVGQYYERFGQVSDEEVIEAMTNEQ
jgi:putative phosphoribosyl transferase